MTHGQLRAKMNLLIVRNVQLPCYIDIDLHEVLIFGVD